MTELSPTLVKSWLALANISTDEYTSNDAKIKLIKYFGSCQLAQHYVDEFDTSPHNKVVDANYNQWFNNKLN